RRRRPFRTGGTLSPGTTPRAGDPVDEPSVDEQVPEVGLPLLAEVEPVLGGGDVLARELVERGAHLARERLVARARVLAVADLARLVAAVLPPAPPIRQARAVLLDRRDEGVEDGLARAHARAEVGERLDRGGGERKDVGLLDDRDERGDGRV